MCDMIRVPFVVLFSYLNLSCRRIHPGWDTCTHIQTFFLVQPINQLRCLGKVEGNWKTGQKKGQNVILHGQLKHGKLKKKLCPHNITF